MLLGLILIVAAPFLFVSRILGVISDLSFWLSVPVALGLVLYSVKVRGARYVLAAASAFSVFGLLCLYAYKAVTLANIHSALLLQSLRDASVTVAVSFSPSFILPRLAAGLIAALTQFVLVFAVERGLGRHFAVASVSRRQTWLMGAMVALAGLVYVRSGWASLEQYRDSALLSAMREQSVRDPVVSGPADDVLILQLESVNAKALFDWDRGGFREVASAAGLRRLWRERGGVLFPFFWANSSITNRALESILCGISGNMNVKAKEDMGASFIKDCLPNILKRAGFDTQYYYSFFDDLFYGYGRLMPRYGFDRMIFGSALMAGEDRRFAWGYDDCQFYRRIVQHAKAHWRNERPRFTYVSVSMHHEPFDESRYPKAWSNPDPSTKIERYTNSLLEQDHCVANFGDVIDAFDPEHLHVFIVGDHSIPLAPDIEPEDRFFTSLLYLPPIGRRKPPRAVVTAQPPSQADLVPTILDLLYHVPTPRSFADVLRGGAYDERGRCATSVNGNGIVMFSREGTRAVYEFEPAGVATVWTRPNSLSPWTFTSKPTSFPQFYEAHHCRNSN